MQLSKPEVEKVVVTVRDPDGDAPSKSITVYNTTPEILFPRLQLFIERFDEFMVWSESS